MIRSMIDAHIDDSNARLRSIAAKMEDHFKSNTFELRTSMRSTKILVERDAGLPHDSIKHVYDSFGERVPDYQTINTRDGVVSISVTKRISGFSNKMIYRFYVSLTIEGLLYTGYFRAEERDNERRLPGLFSQRAMKLHRKMWNDV